MPLDNIDNVTPPAAPPPPVDQQQQQAAPTAPTQDNSAQLQNVSDTQPAAKPTNSGDQIVNGVGTPQPDPIANHPLVQKAGLLNAVAQTLSGGPRYTESID